MAMLENDVDTQSKKVADNFFSNFPVADYSAIHIFLPILKNKEINTFYIIEKLKADFPKVKIIVPKVDAKKERMQSLLLEKDAILKDNSWGIPEPEKEIVYNGKIDLVLMPLLAFDVNGNRLGYGKGFYDRFLSTLNYQILKVGLSINEPFNGLIPAEKFDIPMDACITPELV